MGIDCHRHHLRQARIVMLAAATSALALSCTASTGPSDVLEPSPAPPSSQGNVRSADGFARPPIAQPDGDLAGDNGTGGTPTSPGADGDAGQGRDGSERPTQRPPSAPDATAVNPDPPGGRSTAIRLEPGPAIGASCTWATSTYRINMVNDGACMFGHSHYMDPTHSPYITGVSSDLFQDSKACGKCYLVERGRRKTIIVVGDLCPECKAKSFDFAQPAAQALSDNGRPNNYTGLKYTPVACNWQGHGLEYYFDGGSSEWGWYLLIFWNTYPIKRVTATVQSTGKTYTLSHDPYGRFIVAGRPGTGRIAFRIEAEGTSQVVRDTVQWNGKPEVLVRGTGVNFKLNP